MENLLTFFTALVITITIIPVMARLAPRLGMLDTPDARKVHRDPIPRTGGVGIVIGVLTPLILWMPADPLLAAFVFGAVVVLAFGLWDDTRGLPPGLKFVGQFLAVIPAVYYWDLSIAHFPLFGDVALPAWLAQPLTVFLMVGMINAINTSDGLDGLAGGLSMLSLATIGYLAYDANGYIAFAMAAATCGGVLGFLRYNTHPARVFMGDTGSQFLGFTLGFLAIVLTQRVNPALSPALPALLLGLPVADLLAVMAQRIYRGASCFRADKNHVHHRLLEIGFDHHEAVVTIYSIQTLFMLCALFLRYESDSLILGVYVGVSVLLFTALLVTRRGGWRARRPDTVSRLTTLLRAIKRHGLLTALPTRLVTIALPVLLLAVSLLTDHVPRDVALTAAVLAVLLMLYLGAGGAGTIVPRAIIYVTAAFVTYLETRHTNHNLPWFTAIELTYFALLAIAVALAVRFGNDRGFKATPMDFLVVTLVLALGLLSQNQTLPPNVGMMTAKLVIIFYGCELILSYVRTRWNALSMSTIATLSVLGVRGLL